MKKLLFILLTALTSVLGYSQGESCGNPISLPCGTSGFSGSSVGAANNAEAGNCGSNYGQWYEFTGDGTITTISCVTNGFDPAMQTYSGVCGALVSLNCADGAGSSGTESYTFTTSAGTQYYVFISYYNQYALDNSNEGLFTMSRSCPVAPCAPVFTAINGANNCPVDEFYINVDITDLGSATTVELSNDGGFAAITGINSLGIQTLGPFSGGNIVNVVVENEADNTCTANTNVLTRTCVPCDEADPFCSDIVYNFPTNTDVPDGIVGPDYGCLATQPNPVWYYMKIDQSGDLNLEIESSCGDIDYAAWGPFTSTSCRNADLTTSGTFEYENAGTQTVPLSATFVDNFISPSGNMIDCAYSIDGIEELYIPAGVTGDFYMVMITNYANCVGNYTFSKTSGSGTTDCAIVLPVVLYQFDVNCSYGQVDLQWTTLSESNNDYFTIERSKDAINFEPVGTVKGNGNSSSLINYKWSDPERVLGKMYYRLKQTDFDGSVIYHNVETVECEQISEISIYPNPFENSFVIQLSENIMYPVNLEILDYLGRPVYSTILTTNRLEVDLDSDLPQGTYFIKVFNEKTMVVERIMKTK